MGLAPKTTTFAAKKTASPDLLMKSKLNKNVMKPQHCKNSKTMV